MYGLAGIIGGWMPVGPYARDKSDPLGWFQIKHGICVSHSQRCILDGCEDCRQEWKKPHNKGRANPFETEYQG
jgi:hypothetical protein